MKTPYDSLVELCETGIADTYRYERQRRLLDLVSWALVVFCLTFLTYALLSSRWWMAIPEAIALGVVAMTLRRSYHHKKWIIETREYWISCREDYIFSRAMYVEELLD